MDHRDKIRQNLELLKLDTLKDISLNDLESEIREKFPAPVGDGRRLHVFMAWLHDRLTFIDTSDEFLLSREINEWATFLIFCGYHKLDLADAFDDWCHEQSAIDPSSIRRLELAALEMEAVLSVSFANRRQQRQAIMAERLMPKRGFFALRPLFSQLDEVPETYEPPNKYGVPRVNEVPEVYEISKVNEASLAYGNLYLDRPQLSGRSDPIEVNTMDASGGSLIYGNMHPDRLKLSARNDALEVGVRGGSLVYSNMHPDRLKLSEQRMGDMAGTAIDIDTWKTPFIDLSLDDDSPNRQNDQTTTDLSFLTGANKMVFDNGFLPSEMNRETERTIVDEPSRSDPATDLRHSRYFEGGNIRGGKLPKGYVCKICDIPGTGSSSITPQM
ncbi:hypothetical protein B0T25DRAFT_211625 [Lasiosphaeria hispida]|uniref:Uncharacterized protein n=1 Tax=Lasiosphaeria hispida TaxID=260671 RepID=A0AAJ0HIQ0_9PEZI|nr:hypothetical protein B0T25DRAFT_211625 [Lasiosphaeria hispida]